MQSGTCKRPERAPTPLRGPQPDELSLGKEALCLSKKRARGVHWPDAFECVWFVETEFGLRADASERERRAYNVGLERAKLRREAAAKGAGGVARKPEGKGYLCATDDALSRAEEIASEVRRWLAGI